MSKIIIMLITLFALAYAQAGKNNKISCICNAEVGVIGLPEFNEVIEIKVQIDANGYYEASGKESDIVISYKCLTQKNDVRKILDLKSIQCED